MLSIFFTIFGSIGILLNWPVIEKGIFRFLTKPQGSGQALATIKEYCSGFYRLDGYIIIAIALLILISAFMRTSKTLLNMRIIFLVIVSAIVSAELFMVIQAGSPFHQFTGLLYSSLFFLMGLVAAVFKFGSMKSFNSTFAGKPMSESRVFSQTFSQVISRVSKTLNIECRAGDDIDIDWKKDQIRQFTGNEIKIGRDRNWANMAIGSNWNTVSSQHGIIRLIGNSMIYEPVSSNYAYAIDGKPFSVPKEVPDQSRLSLVSGMGPEFTMQCQCKKNPVLHPKTMFRAGEIARDEFKRLQHTFKILVVLVLLALPMLWVFSSIQKRVAGEYVNEIMKQNQDFTRELKGKMDEISDLNRKNQTDRKEIGRLKNKISQIQQYGDGRDDESKASHGQIKPSQKSGSSKKVTKELKQLAKVIDIKMSSQRISVYFPFLTFFGDSRVRSGSGFFINGRGNSMLLVTEKSSVKDSGYTNNIRTYIFLYPDSWKAFQKYHMTVKGKKQSAARLHSELKRNASRYNVMIIDGRNWRSFGREYSGNSIVSATIKNFPDYLHPYVPRAGRDLSRSDRVIVYGFQSGEKAYSNAFITNISKNIIRVRTFDRLRLAGGLLLRVLSNGTYTAAGVLHTGGGRKAGSEILFLRF
jgi:hypothetical protein